MKRALWCSLLALTTSACGPSGASAAIFKLINAGEGSDLVTHISDAPGSRWLYLVSGGGINQSVSDTRYLDTFQLPEGPLVERYITEGQVIYLEQSPEGRYYWGSSDGDVLKHPLVELSYPLRLNRTWQTGNENYPDWYQYSVDGVETLETPAGTYEAVRLLQFNSRSGNTVTRWFAENVGMVQRHAPGTNNVGAVKTTLLSFYEELR
jgi:hypothetical protein